MICTRPRNKKREKKARAHQLSRMNGSIRKACGINAWGPCDEKRHPLYQDSTLTSARAIAGGGGESSSDVANDKWIRKLYRSDSKTIRRTYIRIIAPHGHPADKTRQNYRTQITRLLVQERRTPRMTHQLQEQIKPIPEQVQ